MAWRDHKPQHAEAARLGWRRRKGANRYQNPTKAEKRKAKQHYQNSFYAYQLFGGFRVAEPAILSKKERSQARSEVYSTLKQMGREKRA